MKFWAGLQANSHQLNGSQRLSTTLKTTLFRIGSIRLLGRYVDARFAASGLAPDPTAIGQ